jgi:hypothetical protein
MRTLARLEFAIDPKDSHELHHLYDALRRGVASPGQGLDVGRAVRYNNLVLNT